MTSEEKFEKAHEILKKATAELKKIGFNRYMLAAFRPDPWIEKHMDIASQGIAVTIYGSTYELLAGLAYMYGMMRKEVSKEEGKIIRAFIDRAFDAAESMTKEEKKDEEFILNQIKISKAKAKNMTVEELIKTALKEAVEEDEDEDEDEDGDED